MTTAPDLWLAHRLDTVQRWLMGIYRLDVRLEASRCVLAPESARTLQGPAAPRSGVLAVEEEGTLWLGVYLDPRDRRCVHALVEETSHLVCLAWHAESDRPVSRLVLELQGEVDQYVVNRLRGRDAMRHFRDFRWADGMDGETRERYATANRIARRYCRSLARRFPQRSDTPALLREVRTFYRAPSSEKLGAGA